MADVLDIDSTDKWLYIVHKYRENGMRLTWCLLIVIIWLPARAHAQAHMARALKIINANYY